MRTTQADELAPESKPVQIPAAGVNLNADLTIPGTLKQSLRLLTAAGAVAIAAETAMSRKPLMGSSLPRCSLTC